MFKEETIVAISTSLGNSGIGIIRVSGSDAINIVNEIFVSCRENKNLLDVKTHTVNYGNIVDNYTNKVVDEVLVIVMKAPNTYTRENVVEINCHGGILVTKNILELVIKNGARCAEPGEFTKRAFLNGRIDLSQAESVMELINAKSNLALDTSINQLKGKVRDIIKKIRSKLIYHIAFIESALDDPEHISLDNYSENLKIDLEDIENEINSLIESSNNGRMLSEGIKTVILGKPNAGKSSLLNCLLGEDRAIVTNIAGTTRDTLEEKMSLSDISLNIIDTAGIRETEDVIEKIGVDKALEIADTADLILYVVDSSQVIDENDLKIINIISRKNSIVILNKSDLECIVNVEEISKLTNKKPIYISAKDNKGLKILEEEIKNLFYNGNIFYNDQIYITNMRHKDALIKSYEFLKLVNESINNGLPEDFYSIDLMSAYEKLGEITGESVNDDLVNEIFSKFCMGK